MNLRHSPLAAGILAVLTTPVQAETPESEAAPTPPTLTVTESAAGEDKSYTPAAVPGRLPADLRDTPQSVTVINKRPCWKTRLVEAMRNVPGISLSPINRPAPYR